MNIFDGTEGYYRAYRMYCPDKIVDFLVNKFNIDKSKTLLDLGCGTGQICFPFSPYFNKVVAIDISEGMIKEARAEMVARNISNVELINEPAENIDRLTYKFDLVTFGASFHWMNQEEILVKLDRIILDGGGIAILSGKSAWTSDIDWQKEIKGVVQKYLGEERRAGDSSFPERKSFKELLMSSSFERVKRYEFRIATVTSFEELIGGLFSTSFANPRLLGENTGNFRKDVMSVLEDYFPRGKVEGAYDYEVLVAKRK